MNSFDVINSNLLDGSIENQSNFDFLNLFQGKSSMNKNKQAHNAKAALYEARRQAAIADLLIAEQRVKDATEGSEALRQAQLAYDKAVVDKKLAEAKALENEANAITNKAIENTESAIVPASTATESATKAVGDTSADAKDAPVPEGQEKKILGMKPNVAYPVIGIAIVIAGYFLYKSSK